MLFLSWVDDIFALGEPADVEKIQIDLEEKFTCKLEGEMTEYAGSKLE